MAAAAAAAAATPGTHAAGRRLSARVAGRRALRGSSVCREQQRNLDDLISRLPDDLLGAVISLLPTKDGARTQILSRRWRPLWRSSAAPLNLSTDHRLCADIRELVAFVRKILSDHPGPTRRLSLRHLCPLVRFGVIEGWLRSESLANLQELEFAYAWSACACYPLPPSALPFAPTLRVAKFGSCRFPEFTAETPSPKFPHLKQLTMRLVRISEDSLHSMLSSCTVLESLSLDRNSGIARLCINSPTLRCFSFSAPWDKQDIITCQELLIQDVPCLERLLLHDSRNGPATIRIIRAPKMEILGLLSQGTPTFHPGTTLLQKMIHVSLTTKMHKMKILVLDTIGPNLDAVVDLLNCFPYLEKLYVILHPHEDMYYVRKYVPLDPVECLELRLKKVVLRNYDGNQRPVINFAKFFVLNAKVLKEMEIGVVNSCNNKWMCFQRKRLRVEHRASRDAQIELKRDTKKSFKCHGFSKADPFDMSSY
ncbi:putative FBD-associated F-box protein At5g22720 [Hordeum vulgare subsp. vulgare]|uniref:FBD domain-containing protein n=1 Tax=Hordeum vulgare subsp. vulgare TaxID=112509 RepID=A0A8I6WF56_HORVV|nr:putative FBD-associated F-box protein At5g22720 [Hordeum vulgare subsp. vulgare]